MSTSPYRVVPQTPVQAVSNTELDGEDDDDVHNEPAIGHPFDKRITYIHFILGSAVLLPWNSNRFPSFLILFEPFLHYREQS
jgi:hypothetical protein